MFSKTQDFETKIHIFIICMHLCNVSYHLPLVLWERAVLQSVISGWWGFHRYGKLHYNSDVSLSVVRHF